MASDAETLSTAVNANMPITERRGQQARRRRPIGIVVLGMHRSGTSALTRIINLAGADLPTELLGATSDNPTGHWESEQVHDLHNAFMSDIGGRWDDWRQVSPEWL
ncbi:MAG TPA: hypothetical protein VHX39_19705, partial [Acetobacteraceae bacterium]|nr:hypothetical protein [Acetobacteraceae bacterium]